MPENVKAAHAGHANGFSDTTTTTNSKHNDSPSIPKPNGAVKGGPNLLPFYFNDWGNAQRLLEVYGADMRYCHDMRKWLIWDKKRWCPDKTGRAKYLARRAMLVFLGQALEDGGSESPHYKFARESLNAGPINSLLAMAEPESYITPDLLDTHPHLLTFENGTVDLSTGVRRSHRREDLITKIVRHNYLPDAKCPRWITFLNECMGVNADATEGELEKAERLVSYLQRALGYSATGHVSEKAVFIAIGKPDAGKSTLLNTFRAIFQEHSTLIQIDTLMLSKHPSANAESDKADLRGARFAQNVRSRRGATLGVLETQTDLSRNGFDNQERSQIRKLYFIS